MSLGLEARNLNLVVLGAANIVGKDVHCGSRQAFLHDKTCMGDILQFPGVVLCQDSRATVNAVGRATF